MLRLILKLRLMYVRMRIRWVQLDYEITQAEITSGPERLAMYQEQLQRWQGQAAAIQQLM